MSLGTSVAQIMSSNMGAGNLYSGTTTAGNVLGGRVTGNTRISATIPTTQQAALQKNAAQWAAALAPQSAAPSAGSSANIPTQGGATPGMVRGANTFGMGASRALTAGSFGGTHQLGSAAAYANQQAKIQSQMMMAEAQARRQYLDSILGKFEKMMGGSGADEFSQWVRQNIQKLEANPDALMQSTAYQQHMQGVQDRAQALLIGQGYNPATSGHGMETFTKAMGQEQLSYLNYLRDHFSRLLQTDMQRMVAGAAGFAGIAGQGYQQFPEGIMSAAIGMYPGAQTNMQNLFPMLNSVSSTFPQSPQLPALLQQIRFT